VRVPLRVGDGHCCEVDTVRTPTLYQRVAIALRDSGEVSSSRAVAVVR
jgi:hypothetical protein